STADVGAATKCHGTVWGASNPKHLVAPDTVHKVKATVIDHHVCNENHYYNLDPPVTKSMLRAGDAWKDAYQGHSGGPLICNGVLWYCLCGYGCRDPQKPEIYTLLNVG
ncbi:Granzyme K, partial [Chelonia mydas]